MIKIICYNPWTFLTKINCESALGHDAGDINLSNVMGDNTYVCSKMGWLDRKKLFLHKMTTCLQHDDYLIFTKTKKVWVFR